MARGERICVVCGKEYIYCPNCKKGDPNETWRFMYDSEECRDIFKICSNFAFGHINAETAKKKLEKYDVADRSRFSDDIKKNLSAIFAAKAENAPKKAEAKEADAPKKEEAPKKEAEENKGRRKAAE